MEQTSRFASRLRADVTSRKFRPVNAFLNMTSCSDGAPTKTRRRYEPAHGVWRERIAVSSSIIFPHSIPPVLRALRSTVISVHRFIYDQADCTTLAHAGGGRVRRKEEARGRERELSLFHAGNKDVTRSAARRLTNTYLHAVTFFILPPSTGAVTFCT